VNHVLFIIAFIGLLLLPGILLGWRTLSPEAMPWWLVLVLAAAMGWMFTNGTVYFYCEYLNDLVLAAGPNPSPELVERLTNDGAKRVFAAVFGWLYGLVLLAFWWLIFGAIRAVCRFVSPIQKG
jgi:hypothetical protein